MPKIRTNNSGGMIRWDGDDWVKGMVPHFINVQNIPNGDGFLYQEGINPYSRPGYLIQGPNPANVTNASVISAVLKNGVGNGSNAYAIEAGTKLHQLSATNGDVTSGGAWPRTISSHGGGYSGVIGQDVVLYYVGTTKYLFYSWFDNNGTLSRGDVGRYDLSATFDDDFMTTVPSGATATGFEDSLNPKPLPMIVGDNNVLYIGNGRYVAAYDGRIGTPTINYRALDLPSDYIVTSFAKLPNFLVIFAYKGATASGGSFYKTESTAFFWDCLSDSFTYAYTLPGNYVNGGFTYKNTVGCFVSGANFGFSTGRKNKMVLFNGNQFETILNFDSNISIPGHGGVDTFDNVILWNSSGKIYQYGSPIVGIGNNAINIISAVSGGTSSEGMLRLFNTSNFVASAGTGTSGGLQNFSSGAYAARWITPVIHIPFEKFSQARVTRVKTFWFGTSGAGHGMTLNLNTDFGTATTIISNSSAVNNYITDYTYASNGNELPTFSTIQVETNYSSSGSNLILQALEIYFEYTNIPIN